MGGRSTVWRSVGAAAASPRSSCISRFGCSHHTIVLPPPVPSLDACASGMTLVALLRTSSETTFPSAERAKANLPSSVSSGSLDGAKLPGAVA